MLSRKRGSVPAVPAPAATKFVKGQTVAFGDQMGGVAFLLYQVAAIFRGDDETVYRVTPIDGPDNFGAARSFLTPEHELVAVDKRVFFAKGTRIYHFDGVSITPIATVPVANKGPEGEALAANWASRIADALQFVAEGEEEIHDAAA